MSRRDDDLMFDETAAHHEAGHAFTAVALGVPLKEVRVRDRDDWAAGAAGNTLWKQDGSWAHPLYGGSVRACRGRLRMVVAGPVAEHFALRLPTYREAIDWKYLEIPDEPIEGSDEDRAQNMAARVIQAQVFYPKVLEHFRTENPGRDREWLRDMARPFAATTKPTREQLASEIRRAERSAVRLLLRNWATVDKLAQALDRRGRLTGRQVGRLLAA
jgi:hypothetical protein